MALTRYQKGSLLPKTGLPKNRLWIGRWREDVVQPDGTITRPYKWEVLGTTRDYPTRKLALRALEARLSTINSPTYRARRQQGLPSLRTGGRATVLSQHKPSKQNSIRSQLRRWLLPGWGGVLKASTASDCKPLFRGAAAVPKQSATLSQRVA